MSGRDQDKSDKPAPFSPGQIAELKEAAKAGKKAAGNTGEHVGREHLGRLSAPDTPGHTTRHR
jgi:hypothetical protein